MKAIDDLGAIVEFDSVVNKTFENNLKMIDSLLPEALAEILMNSYRLSEKNLSKLFENSSIYENEEISRKKMADLLLASSLGMFPSEKWDGKYTADGGILIVSIDGHIYALDLVYYRDELIEYLLKNTKLDSPSSSRYHMLNLFKENDNVYFTLNLQIRYI